MSDTKNIRTDDTFEVGLPCRDIATLFLKHLETDRDDSPDTIRAYRDDLESYLRWAGGENIDPLSPTYHQLRAYLGKLDREGDARSTIVRHMSSLRTFFNWASGAGISQDDPTIEFSHPKTPRRLPRVLTGDDIARLLAVYGPVDSDGNPRSQTPSQMRDAALLEFLFSCGARVAEASGLRVSWVNFKEREVKVLGKRSKERIVPLSRSAASAMSRYLKEARPKLLCDKHSDYFFVSTRGNQMKPDAIRKMFKKALRAAGLDPTLSPHSMRHTFATSLMEGGADLKSIQDMLGHNSMSTTEIYTHVSSDRMREVFKMAHPRA